ncbi:MAG: acetyl-CoA carboxylase carboxyltransferase subunit beta [Lachnospiraceae bacterium]|jgi:acetyl-CoA carboxylase carboxyl transferase beta subunit/acetyl-CoA carboxylase carboxyl transferase alpha subunit|nr:acetyl-CoA carboxylase carboxyltransferase subunit beta [Lachnospiraceae bacterium]NBJ83309.1 acetyl-CoA carboxylase carboxyltransferase subunit beta [bacterium 1XD42-76]NBK06551.1 acetyl-CoA carboxylase carboxyltransferase subunit beta [bacterium 1XD42-94]
MLRNMFKKTYTKINIQYQASGHASTEMEQEAASPVIPAGLWRKCNKCGKPIYAEDVRSNFYICPKCGGYFRISAYRRLEMLADEGSFEEWDREMEVSNPLGFPGYEKKLAAIREKTRLNEAIVTGKATIGGYAAVLGVCDARFMMSSMGHNVGEKITRAIERATRERLPVILFACSGGARMQEGLVSLMQMAKTAAALKRHHEAGQLFISALTDPTTGGVTASFAMLGDIILAEPNALIGFAGARVIEQTIGQKLPEGFQRAEFLLEHGFIDKIVKREEWKETLARLLRLHEGKEKGSGEFAAVRREQEKQEPKKPVTTRMDSAAKKIKSAWDSVQLSRRSDRLTASDYIRELFEDFEEFHGDRYFKDDGAIIGGIASFHGLSVTVIGQEKGRNTKENLYRNFGMPSPEGYRKALRLMKQAETFGRPIVCFVDTPGAFCGIEAEERGQGEAIARCLLEMSDLKVPVLSIVIGEGGSGGALALAVANEVWMMENAVYSVLSPEGFASILWKDSKRADEAAQVMKMTSGDLLQMGLIERVIPEEEPASRDTLPEIGTILDRAIQEFFDTWLWTDGETLAKRRYERFRKF